MPYFEHEFFPSASTVNQRVFLSIREIEDAGLKEVLQAPGTKLGQWGLLGPLLEPGTTDFIFREPLGQSREVKTAVSGLFGRFVARAYATRYLRLTHFAHVRRPPMQLSGQMNGVLRRVRNATGDMPDWVAWGSGAGLAIVEAKGSHEPGGPIKVLDRAYTQASRAEIAVRGRLARFKRYAIATRWGFAPPLSTEPMLWVQDPDVEGEATDEELKELAVGISRINAASLIRPLGNAELANALLKLVEATDPSARDEAQENARTVLGRTPAFRLVGGAEPSDDELVGGVVTRGGPVLTSGLSPADQDTLERLDLNPSFVGVSRAALSRAIEGTLEEADEPNKDLTRATVPEEGDLDRPSRDAAGALVIRLDRGEGRIQRSEAP